MKKIILFFLLLLPVSAWSGESKIKVPSPGITPIILNQKYEIKTINAEGVSLPIIILLDTESGHTWWLNMPHNKETKTYGIEAWVPIFVDTNMSPNGVLSRASGLQVVSPEVAKKIMNPDKDKVQGVVKKKDIFDQTEDQP